MGELEPLRDGILNASQGLFQVYQLFTPFQDSDEETILYWHDDDINKFLTVAKNLKVDIIYLYANVADEVHPGEIDELQVAFYYEDRLHLFSKSASWSQDDSSDGDEA